VALEFAVQEVSDFDEIVFISWLCHTHLVFVTTSGFTWPCITGL